jgi:flagellar FliJ protein
MAKKFKFRLEVLLTHRKRLEDEQMAELAKAIQFRISFEQALQAVKDREQEALEEQANLQVSGLFNAMDLQNFVMYRKTLASKVREAEYELEKAQLEENAARKKLIAARQDREVLDRLKGNQYEAYLKDLDQAEARVIDELATGAFLRQKRQPR